MEVIRSEIIVHLAGPLCRCGAGTGVARLFALSGLFAAYVLIESPKRSTDT